MANFYAKQTLIYPNEVEVNSYHQFDSEENRDKFLGKSLTKKKKGDLEDIATFTKKTSSAAKRLRVVISEADLIKEIGGAKIVKHSYINPIKTDNNKEKPVKKEEPVAKPKKLILRVEDNKTFETMADALESIGLNRKNYKTLSKILRFGEDREYYGYHWRYV